VPDVRAHPRHQLVGNDAEAIDIARRAKRLAANLLGTGVVKRQRPHAQRREFAFLRLRAFHQLGNAEVEQTHLAFGCDEDVGGLEITVHDEAGMRMGDRVCDLQHKPEASGDRQCQPRAVDVDALAEDVFEREIRPAPGCRARRRRCARCSGGPGWPECPARGPSVPPAPVPS